MKKLLIFLVLFASKTSAQITFEKTFEGNDELFGYSVQQTYDGGYIIAGQNLNFPGHQLLLLIKTDSLGDTLWTKSYEGTFELLGLSIVQTFDSSYVICGQLGDGNGNTIFLLKTDQFGNIVWTKRYSSSATEVIGGSMKQTPDSGFIFCGHTLASNGTGNLLVIKTDSQGDTIWTRLYGSFSSYGNSVDVTKDNSYIISGEKSSYPVLLKIDLNGNIIFLKQFNLVGYETRIRSTIDGGYLMTGASNPTSYNDAFLIKTDSSGNVLWVKIFDGPLSYNDWGNTILETTDSSFLVTVETGSFVSFVSQLQLIKINRNGNLVWSRIFDGTNSSGCYFDACACEASDGGFVISGYRVSPASSKHEIYLIKTDSSGNTDCNTFIPSMIDTFITCSAFSLPFSTSAFPGIVSSFNLVAVQNMNLHTLCSSTNIQQNNTDQKQLKILPVPACDYFQIKAEGLEINTIEIFNSLGEKSSAVMFDASRPSITVDCSSLPEGMYFIVVGFSNGEKRNTRILIAR